MSAFAPPQIGSFPSWSQLPASKKFFDDGDIDYTIFVGTAITAIRMSNGMNPDDVMVTNRDDDTAGVTITQSGGSTNVAGGATNYYEPAQGNVTINVSGSQVSVSPTSRTFATDWNTPEDFYCNSR